MAKRNLLVVTNSFPDEHDRHIGGVFVKDQLREMSPFFDEVYVVFPSTLGMGHEPKDDFKDYTFGNVRVFFLAYLNVPLFLKVLRGGFTFMMAGAIGRLLRRERLRFDIIHAHFTWPSGAAAARLKRKYKVPLVVTEHTSLTLRAAIAGRDPQYLDTWAACDAVIRNRKGDIKDLVSAGVPEEKVHYIPNGFDAERFRLLGRAESRERLGIPAEGKVLVSIGGLEEVKGHRHLVDAMAEVARSRGDVTCYIIGEGELHEALRKQVEALGLAGKVVLAGRKPHGELPYWVNAADLVVHSSLSESGPMVMLEALGCGRPFIGTEVGSVPEVITSDDYGLVCRPGDPSALARVILAGLEKQWDSVKIASYSKQYSSEWVSKELVAMYTQLLEGD
jgi:glycosyltransferase involved in cell wall biosynthesis